MFLIVGGDSEIGRTAVAELRQRGPVLATTRRPGGVAQDRIALDLARESAAFEPPAGVEAACLCAAVARLADCAADPAGSSRINVSGTLALAEKLIARGIYVLFLSTNQVFDGWTPHMTADAPTAPVSEYGKQKARTEAALCAQMRRGAPVAILRLAKVISSETALLRDWAAALAAGKPIRAFHDMTMAPVAVETVVAAIDKLMRARAAGIFQLSGPEDVAYTEAGAYLAERLAADPSLVVRTSVAEANLPAGAAPRHTTLDSTALREKFGIAAADAWTVLDGVLRNVPQA